MSQLITIDQDERIAALMTKANAVVPAHLQGDKNLGNAFAVVRVSRSWGLDPFMVGQATSVIQGKLMFEGKVIAAAVNRTIAKPLSYEHIYNAAKQLTGVTVSGTLHGEDTPRTVTIQLAAVKTTNAMWQKQPEQQLCYRGAREWARRHAPELMLGINAPEDFSGTQAAPQQSLAERMAAAKVITSEEVAQAPAPDDVPEYDAETGEIYGSTPTENIMEALTEFKEPNKKADAKLRTLKPEDYDDAFDAL